MCSPGAFWLILRRSRAETNGRVIMRDSVWRGLHTGFHVTELAVCKVPSVLILISIWCCLSPRCLWVTWGPSVLLTCISLMASEVEHSLACLLFIVFPLQRTVCSLHCNLLTTLFAFLFFSSLYFLILILSQIYC